MAYLTKLPPVGEISRLLAADQIWAPEELIPRLEAMGLPACRLFAVSSLDQGEQFASRIPEQDFDLIWRGRFGRNSSLQWVSSEMVAGLEALGRRVLLQSPGDASSDLPIPSVSLSWPPDFLPASPGPMAIYAPWEYWYVPREWVERGPLTANRFFTCSEYALQGMVESGMEESWLRHMPVGVDSEAFSPSGQAMEIPGSEGRLVFLFVGGTIYRKGVDILQKAWAEAFSPDDPVMLLIKDFGSESHYRGQNALSSLSRWAEDEALAPVHILSGQIPAAKMPELYRGAQVGVFPYRGEGFCMPALEAMSCGLPIIFPDQGPTCEYCREGGFILETEVKRLDAPSDISLVAPPLIHEVNVDSLVSALRRVASLPPEELSAKGQLARREAEEMSWQSAALAAQAAIEEMEAERPVFTFSPSRPEGQKVIIAARPDFADSCFAEPLARFLLEASPQLPFTLSLWVEDEEAALDALSEELSPLGVDLDGQLPDISLALGSDWPSLALGSDAILLLGQESEDWLGRPQLQPAAMLSYLNTKIGS